MVASFLSRYLMLAAFGAALLVGIQVPNFVDQYANRVDARLRQVQQDLAGFEQIAQRYFNGSFDALIASHATNPDPRIRAEIAPLRQMVESEHRLSADKAALAGPLYRRLWHVAVSGDRTLLKETWDRYAPVFLLDRGALLVGVIFAFGVCLILELLLALARGVVALFRRPARRIRA
ncbi:MAG TPA: DUF2937 family protein [Nevskiaceae bacterium]